MCLFLVLLQYLLLLLLFSFTATGFSQLQYFDSLFVFFSIVDFSFVVAEAYKNNFDYNFLF